uniref:WRKY domain-containing protein n=1 Tax=Leersia perrieri TaxID=77586 RepID=A0A0D9V3P3_9ORYZ
MAAEMERRRRRRLAQWSGAASWKTLPKWSKQVRVSSVQDIGPLDDGFSWRKYGQKDILGAKYPRAYFRCTHRHTQGCHASKQVQRADADPLLFDVVYQGNHTCLQSRSTSRPAAEQQQQPPHEQNGGVSVAFIKPAKDEAGLVHEAPFSFNSTAHDGGAAGALLHGGCGVVTTAASMPSPFVSMATSDCVYDQLGGGSMAGVRNVPDVEFATEAAKSSMADDIDFIFSLDDDADFLDKYPGYF